RGNGSGEGTVVDGERVLKRIRGTLENRQRYLADRHVAPNSDSLVKIDLLVDVALFKVGEQVGGPTPSRSDVIVGGAGGVLVAIDVAGWKQLVGVVIRVQGQTDLLEVVFALGEARCLADLLN